MIGSAFYCYCPSVTLENHDPPPPDDRQDFVAGDLRVNEQPFLTSLHVLFMREHNRSETVSLVSPVSVMSACDSSDFPPRV